MKTLFSLLILIAIAVVGAPVVSGYYFKHNYYQLVNNINSQPQSPQIQILSYKMGWRDSTVELKITGQAGETDPHIGNLNFAEITVNQTVEHGPVIFGGGNTSFAFAKIESAIHLPAPIEQIILGNANSKGIMQITSVIGFDGNWHDKLFMPKIAVNQPGLGQLTFEGITGNLTSKVDNSEFKAIKGLINIGSLFVQGKNGKDEFTINTKPMTLDTYAILDAIGLWTGNNKISVPEIVATDNGNKIFTMSNLNATSDIKINAGKFYTFGEELVLNQLSVKDSPIGDIGPASFKVNLSNLNAQALLKLLEYINKIPDSQTQMSQQQQNEIANLAISVVNPKTEVSTELSGKTTLGQFFGKVTGGLKQGAVISKKPEQLAKDVMVKVDGRISRPLLTQLVEIYVQLNNSFDVSGMNNIHNAFRSEQSGKAASNTMQNSGTSQGQVSVKNVTQDNALIQEANALGQTTGSNPTLIEEQAKLEQSSANNQLSQPATGTNLTAKEEAIQLINLWVAMGFIKQEGDEYITSIIYSNGIAQVNGRPIQALN